MEGVEGPEYFHELVESVNEATQASTISAHETLALTRWRSYSFNLDKI